MIPAFWNRFLHFNKFKSFQLKRSQSILKKIQSITVGCETCESSITGEGSSTYNYYDHSQCTRNASKQDYIPINTFQTNQITFQPNRTAILHEKSLIHQNKHHLFCGCPKKTFLGSDLTHTFGFIALNTQKISKKNLLAQYQPNHHFYYSERKVEILTDHLPKWKTIIDGEIFTSNQTSSTLSSGKSSVDQKVISEYGTSYSVDTGKLVKDVLPLSPMTPPEPIQYTYSEQEIPVNHVTNITPEKLKERVHKKYINSPVTSYIAPKKNKRDVIVIGGGHNGLISAAYLAKAGLDVLVLERRHCVGGAAVTEEMIPNFKFSRASYLAGLLRPKIISDLQLEKYGFEYLPRNPSSFTPTKLDSIHAGKFLLLGSDDHANHQSISQFSKKDADRYLEYEHFLNQVREIMQPLLDSPPINLMEGNWKNKIQNLKTINELLGAAVKNRNAVLPFYELFMGPAQQILDRWFESDILKTTLATDAVIGASISPRHNGSAYVLLHHVMGEAAGKKGVWAYVRGGMGAISEAIAASARDSGAEIITNATVRKILHNGTKVQGVVMDDGSTIEANTVLSGANPYHTFIELMPDWTNGFANSNSELSKFTHHIRHSDYSCGAFKINCAVNKLPNFTCFPSPSDGTPGPMHRGTVHFESTMDEIEFAYREASIGMPATRPVIEMTIPSSLDVTLAPKGQHVVQFFIQYAPYEINPKVGSWADPVFKEQFVERCFQIVEEFCPGFRSSIIGYDALSPLDLERVFGLHKGSISHGAFSLHQLAYGRPVPAYSSHRTPITGLYLCSAGTHPGGGVMGASGRNCAQIVISDIK